MASGWALNSLRMAVSSPSCGSKAREVALKARTGGIGFGIAHHPAIEFQLERDLPALDRHPVEAQEVLALVILERLAELVGLAGQFLLPDAHLVLETALLGAQENGQIAHPFGVAGRHQPVQLDLDLLAERGKVQVGIEAVDQRSCDVAECEGNVIGLAQQEQPAEPAP